MLTVVTPATASRLTTVEHVQDDLGLTLGNPSDAALLRFIDQASQAIVDWCRRPFALETVSETFLFGEVALDSLLSRAPVVEIVSVTRDDVAVPVADYRHDDITGRLRRFVPGAGFLPWSGSVLTVVYRAGYVLPGDADATLPASVERAAIRLVGSYLSAASRDPMIKTETTEGVGSTSWWVPGANSVLADPEAEQLLAPFRRLF